MELSTRLLTIKMVVDEIDYIYTICCGCRNDSGALEVWRSIKDAGMLSVTPKNRVPIRI